MGSTKTDLDLVCSLLSGSCERRRRLAARVLGLARSAAGLCQLGAGALHDLGLRAAETERLFGAMELGRRALVAPPSTSAVRGPEDAFRLVAPELIGCERERFVVALLDVKNRPRRLVTVAEGSVDACAIDLREVFVPALRERASAIVVAHNHPSGDPTASLDDLRLTERLVQAGELLGLALLDHVIVGNLAEPAAAGLRYVSLAECGQVPGMRSVACSRRALGHACDDAE